MLMKGLKRSYCRQVCTPPLAQFYVLSHKGIMGVGSHVPPKYFSLFKVFQDDLDDLEIDYKDYSDVVVGILKGWARGKGFKTIPFRVFCGDWALKQYERVRQSSTVRIKPTEVDKEALFYAEMLVARKFISDNLESERFIRLMDVVDELRDVLDPAWLERYDRGERATSYKVMDELAKEYGLRGVVRSYSDILAQIK